MTEPVNTKPPADHIPGAGIDFASVGRVRLYEPEQVGAELPAFLMPGIRLAASERLLPVTVADLAVGDLLVTMNESSDGATIGRPMQVLRIDADGRAVALDDESLPDSIEVDPSLLSVIRFGESVTAWHVLAAFGIDRCPRCHGPGQQLVYGLVMGEPSASWVIAGCCVPWLRTDLYCPRCEAEWPAVALDDRFGNPNDD